MTGDANGLTLGKSLYNLIYPLDFSRAHFDSSELTETVWRLYLFSLCNLGMCPLMGSTFLLGVYFR